MVTCDIICNQTSPDFKSDITNLYSELVWEHVVYMPPGSGWSITEGEDDEIGALKNKVTTTTHTHGIHTKLIHPHNTHTLHRLSDCTEASSRINILIITSSILHSIYCYTNISSSLGEYPDFRTCQMQSAVYEDHSNCPYYCNIMFVM